MTARLKGNGQEEWQSEREWEEAEPVAVKRW